MEDIVTEIKKLEPKKGNIVFVRVEEGTHPEEIVYLSDALEKHFSGRADFDILVWSDNIDVSVIPEEEMNRAGWYKVGKIPPIPASTSHAMGMDCSEWHRES